MKKVLFGMAIGYALSLIPHSGLTSPAYAGLGWSNISIISHLATGTDEMDYRMNVHLGIENLDTTSPRLDQAIWDALRNANTVEEYDQILAQSPAATWWSERLLSDKQHFIENIQRSAAP